MASKPKRTRTDGRSRRKAVAPAGTPAPIQLGSTALIADAKRLHAELLPLLDLAEPVAIDAGAVERVDTAVLQLLHAFGSERRAQGRELRWVAASAALRAAAQALGLDLDGLGAVAEAA
jgi:anti-anti-sigma regulatory factor